MMRSALVIAAILIFTMACAAEESPTADSDAQLSEHMVAQATLTAHYIAAALDAGMTPAEINATLAQIADATVISEFWITNAEGHVEFTNYPEVDFAFPTDPSAGTQAAPFAQLLNGQSAVVVQGVEPRELDGAPFKYVGVAGVDGTRIVQVGIAVPQ